MTENLAHNFGNPSSSHEFGRKARAAVEQVRKDIAACFGCAPSQVIFTAGGSEADNLVLYNAANHWGVERVISSEIEHHAVLHTLEALQKTKGLDLSFVRLNEKGDVDLEDLERLLGESGKKTLVSLMMVNNEIGNILDIKSVAALCKTYGALFHSDTVQAIGHVPFDLKEVPVDFIAASAHKFHGPKGVGFCIANKTLGLHPMLHGGEQEMGLRAGTENTHGIIGMGKALELALAHLEQDKKYILGLKSYFIEQLRKCIPGVDFNGRSNDLEKGAFHILNVRFPKEASMLLFQLDLEGIAASGGSACQSGSNKGSHVLGAILDEKEAEKTSVRFSFSRFNTREELDKVIEVLDLVFSKA